MSGEERDPRNAPGPFYVKRAQCISCGAPEYEASSLVTLDDDGCYFHRQPETPGEVDEAIFALRVSCIEVYRYGGDDEAIRARLGEVGMGHLCDRLPVVTPSRRDHVRFVLDDADDHAVRVAERLVGWLESTWLTKPSTAPDGNADRAEVTYHLAHAERESRHYTLLRTELRSLPTTGSTYRDAAVAGQAWLLVEAGGRYPLLWLHNLLLRRGARSIRWFSPREWDNGEAGSDVP